MNSAGRCRVRDLVSSCFNTCRLLPLDSEEEPGVSGSTASNRDVASDGRGQKKASDSQEKNAPPVKKNSHSFAEEDYIVFCFGEDGEIHMINDTKPSDKLCTNNTASEEAAASSQPCIISRKSEEKNSVEQSKVDSFESCDSNVSDTSTTSFAFPVLGMEWTGSPAHMPNNQPNAEKRDVCRRCCKF